MKTLKTVCENSAKMAEKEREIGIRQSTVLVSNSTGAGQLISPIDNPVSMF